MKSEVKYIIGLSAVLLATLATFSNLFVKYSLLIFNHFVSVCTKILSNFFGSGLHYVGIFVLISAVALMLVFFLKTVLSLIRTKIEITKLTNFKVPQMPKKVSLICKKINLDESKIIVIKNTNFHAFSFGFLFPKIVLSTGAVNSLSAPMLQAVVLHEVHHLRRYHSLLFIFGEVVASTLFFLPIVSDFVKRMKASFEHEADSSAIKIQGTPRHLQLALIHTLDSYSEPSGGSPGFSVSDLEIRFNRLMGKKTSYKKLSFRNVVFSLFAVFVVSVLLIFPTNVHAKSDPDSQKVISDHCTGYKFKHVYVGAYSYK